MFKWVHQIWGWMPWQISSTLPSHWLTSVFPWQRRVLRLAKRWPWRLLMEKLRQDDTSLLAISFFCAAHTQPTKWAIFPRRAPSLSLTPCAHFCWAATTTALFSSAEPARQKLKKKVRKEETSLVGSCKHFIRPFVTGDAACSANSRKKGDEGLPTRRQTRVLKIRRALPLNYSSGARIVAPSALGMQN